MRSSLMQSCFKNPFYFLALGFGSGLLPKAPGTWGTCAAIPLYLLMANLSPIYYLIVVVIAFCMGIWVCERVTQELGVYDYSGIVWDEIVGFWATMFLIPPKIEWIILGFCLFRLFDIWKPFPIGWIEKRIRGGLGIMLDDLLAALPAFIILKLVVTYL